MKRSQSPAPDRLAPGPSERESTGVHSSAQRTEPCTSADTTPDTEASLNKFPAVDGEAVIPDVSARNKPGLSKKGLLAIALLFCVLSAIATFSIQRSLSKTKTPSDHRPQLNKDRPMAASVQARKLDLQAPPTELNSALRSATQAPGDTAPALRSLDLSPTSPTIPAPVPNADELAEPIGIRRHAGSAGALPATRPEDAPTLIVSSRPNPASTQGSTQRRMPVTDAGIDTPESLTRTDAQDALDASSRNLQEYQRQLQTLLTSLSHRGELADGMTKGLSASSDTDLESRLNSEVGGRLDAKPSSGARVQGAASTTGYRPNTRDEGPEQRRGALFGGQLQASNTAAVMASELSHRSLTLPKGTSFTCALKTRLISAASGLVGCLVQRHVYSDDGRVLLIERGSHMDGEYRVAALRPGAVRIPVLWTRIRTPHGVTVDIDSPGTSALGDSGIDGHVDKRWGERIGAAMLLSLIDDSVKLVIQNQRSEQGRNETILLPSTTANTSKLAEKVLDSTINTPPLIYQTQGAVVGIYVARDVDFSSVYELRATARPTPQETRE